MSFQTNEKMDIAGTVLCVSGLSIMVIGFFILTNMCDISIVLGIVIGSTASILSYFLQVLAGQISEKYNSKRAALVDILLRMFSILLIVTVAFIILLMPLFDNVTGIVSLFFAQISRVIISLIKE
jgi:hypothetical protein